MGQRWALSTCGKLLPRCQPTRQAQEAPGPRSSASLIGSPIGRRVESGGRTRGPVTIRSGILGVGLSWPGGAGLGVGQLLGNSPRLPSGDEGLGESGSHLAGKGPCPRSSDHDRGSRNSSTSPCSLWSHLQSAGPSRRPVDQLTSGRGTEGGDLRRSAPIGAKGDPTYLCPWHDGAGIRISVRYFQVQAVAVREESIVSRRIGGSVSSSSTM